jgi:hypothetical protein
MSQVDLTPDAEKQSDVVFMTTFEGVPVFPVIRRFPAAANPTTFLSAIDPV